MASLELGKLPCYNLILSEGFNDIFYAKLTDSLYKTLEDYHHNKVCIIDRYFFKHYSNKFSKNQYILIRISLKLSFVPTASVLIESDLKIKIYCFHSTKGR